MRRVLINHKLEKSVASSCYDYHLVISINSILASFISSLHTIKHSAKQLQGNAKLEQCST